MTPIWGMSEAQTKALLWLFGSILAARIFVWLLFGFIMWIRQ